MEATKVLDKKKVLTPKLRFKEFVGEWEKKKLAEVFSIFNGYAFSSTDAKEAGCRWVKIADVGINEMNHDSTSYLPIDYKSKYSKYVLREGDYVVALTRPILGGKLKIAKIDKLLDGSLLNQRVGKLLSKNDLTFVYSLLQKKSLISRIENRIAGTDPPNLSPSEIDSLNQFIPTLPEQQKIASFLSETDEKIQQLIHKKKLLEQFKKGVMQQLFSGKLRFKDENGKAFPKWEEKRLGDVAIIKMGQSPDSKSYNNNSVGLLLIQGNADINGRVTNPRQWTSEPTKICEIGDLILTVRAPVGSISKSLHHACLGRGVCSIKNNKISDIEFLFQFLLGYEDKWKKIEQGSTFTAVNGNEINSIKLKVPSLIEQKKIANYLSNIDNKIENVTKQITQTLIFKKGLLQQMFV